MSAFQWRRWPWRMRCSKLSTQVESGDACGEPSPSTAPRRSLSEKHMMHSIFQRDLQVGKASASDLADSKMHSPAPVRRIEMSTELKGQKLQVWKRLFKQPMELCLPLKGDRPYLALHVFYMEPLVARMTARLICAPAKSVSWHSSLIGSMGQIQIWHHV